MNATRMPQVVNELQYLHNVTDSLVDSVKELADRLSPVLLSSEQIQKESVGPESPVEETLVPLAEQIRIMRKRIAVMVETLESIRLRIEV